MSPSCYCHGVPLLSPYSGHRRDSLSPWLKNERLKQNLHFDNCSVAKYIIEKTSSTDLTYRNGRVTELGLHCVSCEDCKLGGHSEKSKQESERQAQKNDLLLFDKGIRRALEKWRDKNNPSQELDQCVLLMIKSIEALQNEVKYQSEETPVVFREVLKQIRAWKARHKISKDLLECIQILITRYEATNK